MSAQNRIKGHGLLSLAKTINFTFDGTTYQGLEGDTLASALLANGVHLAGRSFKYHRPRGILSAGPEEPNALVNIARDSTRSQPNIRATVQELYDGLVAESQNRWPSLAFDFSAINDGLAPFFPAGFYYKTFKWPPKAWDRLYEPIIRAAAGLGKSPTEADPDRYANHYAHCDVLIAGGGIAGLTAALAAAKSGKKVILCDENPNFGGAILYDNALEIDDLSATEWVEKAVAELAALENVRLLTRTTVFGYYAQNFVALAERVTEHMAEPDPALPRERLWQVRAKKVILATGAIERHLVFADNDRPGIMLASAAQKYLNQYGVAVGANVGVFTACDSAWATAFALKKAGVNIAAIVDLRDNPPLELQEKAQTCGIRILRGYTITKTTGRLRVQSITVKPVNGGTSEQIRVDALINSAGWTPSVHLFSQSRGKLKWHANRNLFLPDIYVQDCISVGACNGAFDENELIAEAQAAGNATRKKAKTIRIKNQTSWAGNAIGAAPGAGPNDMVKAFVDFQNDVTAKDIRLAVREGMHSIEHVKRFTTTGMATDQGKLSNMHGLAIAAEQLGKNLPDVGLTTFRAPYTPVTFSTIANHARGPLFDPTRKTPMHQWAVDKGAVFEDVGPWKRAWYFPKAGEDMHAAVNRECMAVREKAGMFDATTLGKIEITGADAAEFLNRLYTNPWTKLGIGRCRYGIMCREDGFIYDDGVIGRMADDRFHVTTTTGGAPRVLNHMEDYLQTEFTDLDVHLTSTSEQWAVIAVQGPLVREIIEPLVEGIDLSHEAMPHMSVREGKICGVPTRLFRMSFTGEMGFEINVPADYGESVWQAVYAQGEPKGLTPYGTEAMHVLRAEKGYIIVGQDTDGTVTPHDAGLSWAIGKAKPDFVGKRGMQRPDLVAEGRRQLVGLRTKNPKVVLEEGAQIVATPGQLIPPAIPMKMIGFVTSSYWSEALGHSIALALVEDGHSLEGDTLYVPMEDRTIEVEVTGCVFYDLDGGRLNGKN